jgi:hypothetical protein
MSDVFLSYSRKDCDIARALSAALESEGYSVANDSKLSPGDNFSDSLERTLSDARAVIVFWSPASTKSAWVREEASYAREQGKLLPITTVPPSDVPIGFTHLSAISLKNEADLNSDQTKQRIIEAVKSMIQKSKSTGKSKTEEEEQDIFETLNSLKERLESKSEWQSKTG